jgi:hypothetical protein
VSHEKLSRTCKGMDSTVSRDDRFQLTIRLLNMSVTNGM